MAIGVHRHGEHTCYCPSCGYEEDVEEGEKCKERICPQCGAQLRAKETGERR
jgi:peptide subunit release factor 1 (eRF1)